MRAFLSLLRGVQCKIENYLSQNKKENEVETVCLDFGQQTPDTTISILLMGWLLAVGGVVGGDDDADVMMLMR